MSAYTRDSKDEDNKKRRMYLLPKEAVGEGEYLLPKEAVGEGDDGMTVRVRDIVKTGTLSVLPPA